jgi:hypothetical protein
MRRRKVLSDYPQIAGHEPAIITALQVWAKPGTPLATRENLGRFEMKQAKLALRRTLWDRTVSPEAKEPARAALRVLKGIYRNGSRSLQQR